MEVVKSKAESWNCQTEWDSYNCKLAKFIYFSGKFISFH